MMKEWHKRILVTVAGMLLFEIGARIPLPGLHFENLLDLLSRGSADLRRSSIFALGIMPYLSAAALMMLLSGIIPPLRRLREGGFGQRRDFDRIIMIVTALTALAQGFGLNQFYKAAGPTMLTVGPTLFQVALMLSLAAGSLLAVTLARWITRDGLGNGIALLLVFGHGRQLISWLQLELGQPRLPAPRSHHWLGLLVFTILLVIILMAWIRARRPLRLIDENGDTLLDAPLRPALTGVLPLINAGALLAYIALIPGLEPLVHIPTELWWSWVVRLVILFPFVWIMGSWLLDHRDLERRLERWGLRLEVGVDVRVLVRRLLPLQFLVLSLFIFCRPLLMTLINARVGLMLLSAGELVVVVALVLEFWRVARLRRDLPDDAVPVLESRVRLELDIAGARLARLGIESWVEDDRIIGVTGSRGPWELCKPRFPALFNYPYLGGGRVRLLLRPECVTQAESEEASWMDCVRARVLGQKRARARRRGQADQIRTESEPSTGT